MKKINPVLLLIIGCSFWGISPVLSLFAIGALDIFFFSFLRFLFAIILLAILFNKKLKSPSKELIKDSLICSIILFFAFFFDISSLKFIEPVKVAFIISFDAIITPVLYMFITRHLIKGNDYFNIIISFIGICFINYNGLSFVLNSGTGIALLAALGYSFYVIFIDRTAKKHPHEAYTFYQLLFVCAIFAFFSIKSHASFASISASTLLVTLITGIFSTGLGYYLLTIAQSKITAVKAGIIYTTVPIFTIIYSKLILNTLPDKYTIIGAILISFAVLNSNLAFISRVLIYFKPLKRNIQQ